MSEWKRLVQVLGDVTLSMEPWSFMDVTDRPDILGFDPKAQPNAARVRLKIVSVDQTNKVVTFALDDTETE